MRITDFLNLLGGLALFLYGMQMMSGGLEAAAGNRMKGILERLTSNRLLGVAVGAGITAMIQSSSATTVMTVGFVNSGMMTLKQAVWIIMGANVGTTVTGQLIAFDVGVLAPLFAFCGVALVVFMKKDIFHNYGYIIAGLGLLFIGMDMMGAAMMPLRENEAFVSMMTRFGSPIPGILAGMLFTAVIQSSSASVGILQALASGGVIGLPSAVYVLFGQNIGTCITAVLASFGAGRNAKRATVVHLLFNTIGTLIFTVICMLTPLTSAVERFTPGNPSAQIANMHTIFNVATTLLLLPLGGLLARLAVAALPEKEDENREERRLLYIKQLENPNEYQMGNSAIIINGISKELERMGKMARDNVEQAFLAVLGGDPERLDEVMQTEEYIDYLNREISQYISRVMVYEMNAGDSANINSMFRISGDIERIGDHALNICEYSTIMKDKHISFSKEALGEIAEMKRISLEAMEMIGSFETFTEKTLEDITGLEQRIDDMTLAYRNNQLERMRSKSCSEVACVLFSEMLTDFERVGDHIMNIGQELPKKSVLKIKQNL